MSIPHFESFMLPALRALEGRGDVPLKEIRDRVAQAERITPEDRRETLPSGPSVFGNRVSWALTHLKGAKLLESPRRAIYRLTDSGQDLLRQAPSRVDIEMLGEIPAYVEWNGESPSPPSTSSGPAPPAEVIVEATKELLALLEAEILDRVRGAPPEFLEQVVVDLLIAMGYGGGDARRGIVIGRSGDGGVDGVIQEDALGLDEVYLQAKRYAERVTVGEPALRDFVGAIIGAGTTKGVFVTTSDFTPKARQYVAGNPTRIVLINGTELARLMVLHGVGVRTETLHEIKRIDEDYFDQESS